MSKHFTRVSFALLLATWSAGCPIADDARLERAALVPQPEEIAPQGIYFTETHRETVALQTRVGGLAVPIDRADIEDAQGPAAVRVERLNDGRVEVRVSAGENAGLFSATVALYSGEEIARVPVLVPIRPPPTCNDNNPCTTDWSEGSTCHHEMRASGSSCDDGNACTVGDMCHDGTCLGEALACADDVACTEDRCDPQLGCLFIEDDARCDDGDPCTEERCDIDGGCSHIPMPEGSVCSGAGGCESVGFCIQGDCIESAVPDGFVCDDGNACTGNDRCLDGVCQGDSEGPAAPPAIVLEEGEVYAPLCNGDFVDDCSNGAFVEPHEVLAVMTTSGVSYVLWRTTFADDEGAACDPNVYYAVDVPDSSPRSPIPPDEAPDAPDNGRAAVAPSSPFCAAAVYLTRLGPEGFPQREFITAVRGAVDGALWVTPYNEDQAEADGAGRRAPDEAPPGDGFDEPEPAPAVGFVVVSARESGASLAVTTGEAYQGGGVVRSWSSVAPHPTGMPSRPGAVAVAVGAGVVTALTLENQLCASGSPTVGFDCQAQLIAYQWLLPTPADNPTSFPVPLPWSAVCVNPGALVAHPRLEVSMNGGLPTFFLSTQDSCTGAHEVRFGELSDGLDPTFTPLTALSAQTISSVHLDGMRLAFTGQMDCGDPEPDFAFGALCNAGGGGVVYHLANQIGLSGGIDVSVSDNLIGVRSLGETQFLVGAGETHQLVDWTDASTTDLVLTSPGFNHVRGETAVTDGAVVVTPTVRNTFTNGLEAVIDDAPLPEGSRALLLHPLVCQ